jgi:hypothetical protein
MGGATIPPLRGRHWRSRAEDTTGHSGRDDRTKWAANQSQNTQVQEGHPGHLALRL